MLNQSASSPLHHFPFAAPAMIVAIPLDLAAII